MRPGSGISSSFSLTVGTDVLLGTLGNDVFTSKIFTPNEEDSIDGLAGVDTLTIESDGSLELPSGNNLKNIENIFNITIASNLRFFSLCVTRRNRTRFWNY